MRIPSGVLDQVIFFVAVDATDLKTRETGLTTFTVYRARDTGAATVMTTPTVAELSAANMPGVYSLLLDEDMTIAAGNDSEEMVFHITQAAMAPVTRAIELYRPKITAGNTLDVTATGEGGIDWANIGSPTTAQNLSATNIDVDQVVASVSGAVGSVTGLTNATIADAVLDEDMTAHQTLGTLGQAIGDPVADTNTIYKAVVTDAAGATVGVDVVAVKADTDDIGVAGAGLTALGDVRIANLDATVSSRLATAGYTAPDNASIATILVAVDTEVAAILAAVDTEVGAIKAKTDSLTFTVAGQADVNLQSINNVTLVGDGSVTPFNV